MKSQCQNRVRWLSWRAKVQLFTNTKWPSLSDPCEQFYAKVLHDNLHATCPTFPPMCLIDHCPRTWQCCALSG